MSLQCNTYFPKILAIQSIRKHLNFNLPSLTKVLNDFHLINEISRASFIYKHGQQWRPKCIVQIVLISNLGFQVLMLNSGIKHAFKYEKKTVTEFSMPVDCFCPILITTFLPEAQRYVPIATLRGAVVRPRRIKVPSGSPS